MIIKMPLKTSYSFRKTIEVVSSASSAFPVKSSAFERYIPHICRQKKGVTSSVI